MFSKQNAVEVQTQMMVERNAVGVMKVTLTHRLIGQFSRTQTLYFMAYKPLPRADHLAQFPELLDQETGTWDKVAVANWGYYETRGEPMSESVAYAQFLVLSEDLTNIYGG